MLNTDISQNLHRFLTTSFRPPTHELSQASLESRMLTLWDNVVQQVPAYRSFLERHGIPLQSIKSLQDFQQLPVTTKDNYIRQYPLAERCRTGQLQACDMIAVSSGSTGEPTVWPRSISDEFEIAYRFEQIFCNAFRADERNTLAVVCFALGTWVGGLYTLNCCRHLAAKGYRITTVAPGNQPTEIFRVLHSLAPQFDQVVLLGYPPFLKNVVDLGLAQHVPWHEYRIKCVMAGEVFSEAWRSLMADRVAASQPCFDFASLYGTADAGVLGNETPLSICIRRWLADHPELIPEFFGEARLPTLVQYDPRCRFFEVLEDQTLVFSGNNGVPLIRYHIADSGGLFGYAEMLERLDQYGFDPLKALAELSDRTLDVDPLPFVYVFGRSHFAVSFFGANIYPENVMIALEQQPICQWVTGKFVMEILEDEQAERRLSLVVELAPNIHSSEEIKTAIATAVTDTLMQLNSEFANYVPAAYRCPYVTLRLHKDQEYFPSGVKHRYTR